MGDTAPEGTRAFPRCLRNRCGIAGGWILFLRPCAIAVQEPPLSPRGGGVEGVQIVVALETGDAKVVDATTSGKVSVKFS